MEIYLDDAEKAAVFAFTSNKVMFAAVKKVLLATIYHQGVVKPSANPTDQNWAFGISSQHEKSNEQMGEELRATSKGLSFLDQGLTYLTDIKIEVPKAKVPNKAL